MGSSGQPRTAGSTLADSTANGAAVLEVIRFEWATPERIELVGVWHGLRARRFIRPTLVLEGEGEPKRLLALLEHKPWPADDGKEWIAAFAWRGEVVKFKSADLNVGSGIDVQLPPPRMRPGKPRRFPHRAVSRDAAREAAEDAKTSSPGIVTDEPRDTATPSSADPDPAEALRVQLDEVRRARDRYHEERDAALEQVKAARGEIEAERQARERAVADARAAERESAGTMLAQGAELRASVERQREMAYNARDEAIALRDAAIDARERAEAVKDDAVQMRKQSERDRDKALAERDRAHKERDRALAAREAAQRERDDAFAERDAAIAERDQILSLHERGLPVHEPKPRFLPEERHPQSDLELFMPRAIALGILLIFAFIVLRLFAGA